MEDEAAKLQLEIELLESDKTKISNNFEEIKDQSSKASAAFKIISKQKLDAESDLKEAKKALSDITGDNPANFRFNIIALTCKHLIILPLFTFLGLYKILLTYKQH